MPAGGASAGRRPCRLAAAAVALLGLSAVQPPPEMAWVRIPTGTVQIGCVPGDGACLDNERPRHQVTITRPFELMATEVTVAQYLTFAQATRRPLPRQPDFVQTGTHPIVHVDWEDAAAFCRWAGGRLPTEAEWEYAARAGHAGRIYGSGDELSSDRANYGDNICCEGAVDGADRWLKTAPVGSFPPNDFGLYDMSGNVWEWVADWHAPYAAGPAVDPQGPATGIGRVARGGSWLNDPSVLRLSVRLSFHPAASTSNVGARCARNLPALLARRGSASSPLR